MNFLSCTKTALFILGLKLVRKWKAKLHALPPTFLARRAIILILDSKSDRGVISLTHSRICPSSKINAFKREACKEMNFLSCTETALFILGLKLVRKWKAKLHALPSTFLARSNNPHLKSKSKCADRGVISLTHSWICPSSKINAFKKEACKVMNFLSCTETALFILGLKLVRKWKAQLHALPPTFLARGAIILILDSKSDTDRGVISLTHSRICPSYEKPMLSKEKRAK